MGSGASSAAQLGSLVVGEGAGEDRLELFRHLVGLSDAVSSPFLVRTLSNLGVGEVIRVLQQHPLGSFQTLGHRPPGRRRNACHMSRLNSSRVSPTSLTMWKQG